MRKSGRATRTQMVVPLANILKKREPYRIDLPYSNRLRSCLHLAKSSCLHLAALATVLLFNKIQRTAWEVELGPRKLAG